MAVLLIPGLRVHSGRTIAFIQKSFAAPGPSKLYLNDTLIGEITIEEGKEYVLNPTRSTYLIEELGYGAAGVYGKKKLESYVPVGMDKEEWEKQKKPDFLSLNTITVDTFQYIGYVNKREDLLIEKVWELGIHDEAPRHMQAQQGALNTSVIKSSGRLISSDIIG